jgi:hypothetical protein
MPQTVLSKFQELWNEFNKSPFHATKACVECTSGLKRRLEIVAAREGRCSR